MPVSNYDLDKRRGRVGDQFPGLWWRRVKSGYVWELKLKIDGELRSDTLDARNERDAIAAWREAQPDHSKGVTVLSRGDVRMADVAALYFAKLDERIAQGKKKAKTRTGYEGSWRLHIEPTFGTTRVKDIDEDALVEFFADLTEKGLAQWSQCGIKNVLNQMFKLARREKWINRNPLEDVDPDDLPTQQRRPDYKPRLFRNEELAGMIEACPDLYRNMLVVMAVTGLRIGELCGLLWQDIDLAARTLSVARQVHFDETSREWTTVGPKGKATAVTNLSVRTIDLLGPAYDALATQQTAEIVKGYGRPTDFVFTTSDWRGASGTPVSPDNFRARGVKVAATDAGLGHVRPHDFRHTTASILAACGVTDVDAAAMMGHTVEVYHRVYAKSFEDARARRATMKALAKYGFETLVKAV